MDSDSRNSSCSVAGAPQIDQIEILGLIGEGGMSQVYKARQATLDRVVAVKVLSKNNLLSEASVLRFQKEVKLSAALDHPNIAKTFGSGFSRDGQPYLLMEFVDGHQLSQELAKGPLKFSRFREIFLPLLSALSYAHDSGVVHRDVKPTNIIICRSDDGTETVKLLDFGVATILEEETREGSPRLTQTGTLVGSPAFMSPEQCLGKPVDARSDLYSLSCLMYQALCGKPPFVGSSAFEIMHLHATGKLPSTRELSRYTAVPNGLAKLVLSGLAKDPANRPANARDFSQKLQKALDEVTLDRAPRMYSASAARSQAIHIAILISLGLIITAGIFLFRVKQDPVSEAKRESTSAVKDIEDKALGDQAEKYFNEHKYADAARCWEELCERIQKRKHRLPPVPMLIALARCEISAYRADKAQVKRLELAQHYIDQVLAAALKSNDKHDYLDLVAMKEDALLSQNKLKEAFAFAKEAYAAASSFEMTSRLSMTQGLTNDLFRKTFPEESGRMLKDTIKAAGSEKYEGKPLANLMLVQLNQCRLYRELGLNREALAAAKKIGDQLSQNTSIEASPRTDILISIYSVTNGVDTNTFQRAAETDLREHKVFYLESPGKLSNLQEILGDSFKSNNNYSKALAYYEQAFESIQSANSATLAEKVNILEHMIEMTNYCGEGAKGKKYRQMLAQLKQS